MKISPIYLFVSANFVATTVAYYKKCYEEFSLCLITNTVDESKYKLTRPLAAKWCEEKSSSLAIITNETVQNAIREFTNDNSAYLHLDVITNGYRSNLDTWGWTTGEQSAKYQNPNVDHHYAYLFVSKDGSIISFYGQAAAKRKFICSFLSHNFSCPEGHQRLGRRCYKIHHQNVTWFDARNICLKEKGSDLANCETGIPSLISERGRYDEYWIGLRRERWIWYNGLRYYADMEYPNWDDGNPSATEKSKCLCLRVINGKWRNCDCMQTYRYICIQAYASGSASTVTASTAKMTTATAEPNTIQSTTTSIHTVGDSSSQFHSDNPPDPLDPWQTSGMILALGIGSACLLILIVVIVVVVFTKNRRSRSGDVGPMNGNSSPPTMHKDDAPNTVYAVVMPNANEPVRSPSEKTINQTVYAELDLEPKRKVAHRASEPVRSLSEKASNQAVYEEVVQKGNRGPTHERAVPESEYANSSLVDSVYANSAQPKV